MEFDGIRKFLKQKIIRKGFCICDGFKGAGGVRGLFSLFDCFSQRSMPATRNFLRIEKILFLANDIAISNLENTYNYTGCANFFEQSSLNFQNMF